MDGELSEDAGRFLTRRMGADEGLGTTWQRYHLIRDCLRRPGEPFALTRLSIDLDQVDREAEDAPPEPARRSARWLRPVAGTAIAASVAAAALVVALNLNPGSTPGDPEPFASPNVNDGLSPATQPVSYSRGSAEAQRNLNRYLLRHNQVADALGQGSFVPLVPIVVTAPVQVIEPDEPSPDEDATATGETR